MRHSKFNNLLALYKAPTFFEILLTIRSMCFFQFKFSSIITPKNFKECSLFISVSLIFSSGRFNGRVFFTLDLWKKTYFVLLALSDNLFTLNHVLIFTSSLFTVSKSVEISFYLSLVSSANMMGSSKVGFDKSLTNIKNNKGPKMDPWGTPHNIVSTSVLP